MKEIVNFFNGLQVTQVKLVGGGIAYVQFKNVDLKQEALTYDLRFMSSKFVHGESLGRHFQPLFMIFKLFSQKNQVY